MERSTVTSKGQTTIPIAIRAFLGLKPGDEVEYIKTRSGKIEITPRKRYTLDDLFGILPKPKKHVTDEEINASIEAFWTRKARKSRPKRK